MSNLRDNLSTYIMPILILILMLAIGFLVNASAHKDGEITLLNEKLATAESVNQGLKDSVGKLVRYQECIARIFIESRDPTKTIEGDINDPEAALENCRIQINGVEVSANPAPSSQVPPSGNGAMATPTPSTNNPLDPGGGDGGGENPTEPPPPEDDFDIPFVPEAIENLIFL